jgi:hypothetical protein
VPLTFRSSPRGVSSDDYSMAVRGESGMPDPAVLLAAVRLPQMCGEANYVESQRTGLGVLSVG